MDKPNAENPGGATSAAGETRQIGIDGMTCDKCALAVERAFRKVQGVREVKVERASGLATVTFAGGPTVLAALRDAVIKAGYKPRG